VAGGAAPSALPVAGPSADDLQHFRQFAQCMREHGVPQADPGPDGSFAIPPPRDGDPAAAAALESCNPLLPDGGEPPQLSPEQLDSMLRFARCMREHGVNAPDPDSRGRVQVDPGDVDDLNSPARQAAAQECSAVLVPEGGAR
jgi:hypothetical protein